MFKTVLSIFSLKRVAYLFHEKRKKSSTKPFLGEIKGKNAAKGK